jgi:predicted nucleic acid-binding protein
VGGRLADFTVGVVETRFAVYGIVSTSPGNEGVRQCLDVLAERGAVLDYNALLEVELAQQLFIGGLRDRHPKVWRRKILDGRARKRASRLMFDGLDAWDELIAAFDHVRVELAEVAPMVPHYMSEYGLESYDAAHAVTAVRAGVPAILTRDTDFANVPEASLTVYTDSSRVDSCRRWRGSRR